MLTAELSVDDPSFVYRLLGERLQNIKEQQEADDQGRRESPAGIGEDRR